MAESSDKFDELRRAWIARHQGWSLIQRRRAEQLGRRVRARQRATVAAVPDPHDDTSMPPLILRAAKSPTSQVELAVVAMVALCFPLGWLAGVAIKSVLVSLIPGTLRAYPVPALLWSGAALALPIIGLYDPAPTFGQIVVVPWLCAQVAAAAVIAGVYGIAEGWLAIRGSDQWWPLTPPAPALTSEDAAEILGPYEITGPAVIPVRPLSERGERTPRW
ncbi:MULTISPECIES: hypothetical protein [Mycolicibacterium]|uniref:hypothetical protein n=1 Tax=Mycolicibacterium TaxID=1866885 RepID=UPI0011DAC83D|nr:MULTISPECIES: hypothetical protein [Mycolicibacterium]TXI58903.1 MAG: hypothetical protein E6Q55_22475 [Mycolicibacterium mageritense]